MRHAGGPRTHVTLVWHRDRREDWIRFGKPVAERIVDRHRRVESYAPGQVLAFVRWAANDYGTVRSSLRVLRCAGLGEALSTVPQVDPGAQILLAASGWIKVRRVLAMIDAIEKDGFDPSAIAPDYWSHAHNRLAAGMRARTYTRARHDAWLKAGPLRP